MPALRVIAGSLKGRAIPLPREWHDTSEATPQKVKEALFSSLGGELAARSFLDLFAGSGQVGVEALSRGAWPVVFNEGDRRKCRALSSFIDSLHLSNPPRILCLKAERALDLLAAEGIRFDCVFCDPPYEKTRGPAEGYAPLVEGIARRRLLHPQGSLVVQHYAANAMAETAGGLVLSATRTYGTSALSYYRAGGDYS